MHRAAIKMLLRVIRGKWPPDAIPRTPEQIEDRQIVDAYEAWMRDLRGLSSETRRHSRRETYRLLSWMREHHKSAATLSVADLDAYLAVRSAGQRRTSIVTIVSTLRGVLRHLHHSGRMPMDLSGAITRPPIYALEGIPSAIRSEDVQRALKALKQDRSAVGRRDYAIWMLLTCYGLRAAEVQQLQLPDVDWRRERLRIRHTKTGAYSEMPLLPGPANALLDYLQKGRPETTARAVFVRAQAPYRALSSGAPLNHIVARGLEAANVVPTGKHGPHALRHARAVSLLRGGVPLKVIGDVLGHRSERSTAVYLKLATEDLRSVALDVPAGIAP
jgi:site-specific recombinase XerD